LPARGTQALPIGPIHVTQVLARPECTIPSFEFSSAMTRDGVVMSTSPLQIPVH
jgi:hypothetical protein